jgi:hypothetical protein
MVIRWGKSITLVILPALFIRVSSSGHNCHDLWLSGRDPGCSLEVRSEKAAKRVLRQVVNFAAMVFSAADDCDVGEDTGAPASMDYSAPDNTVKGVQLVISNAAEEADHLVSPEEQSASS